MAEERVSHHIELVKNNLKILDHFLPPSVEQKN